MRKRKPTGIGLGFYAHSWVGEIVDGGIVASAVKAGPFWGTVRTDLKFTVGAIVAMIAPTPLGLGTFAAGTTGMLVLLGVPIEAAFSATVLMRGMTFWLPMLPGVLIARRELNHMAFRSPRVSTDTAEDRGPANRQARND